MGIKFVHFNRRENRRSLAIFFAEEIAHLGALKIARFCGGAVKKIAAATAENRAILVHSGPKVYVKFCHSASVCRAQRSNTLDLVHKERLVLLLLLLLLLEH